MNDLPDTVQFKFFDFVWMRTDEDGASPGVGQVVGIVFRPGAVLVQVQWNPSTLNDHYQEELTNEKPVTFTP